MTDDTNDTQRDPVEVEMQTAPDGEPEPPNQRFRTRQSATVRKITACESCRRLKIKCHMPNSGVPPCTRCNRRGFKCAVGSSRPCPPVVAEDHDNAWKSSVTQKLESFEDFVHDTSQRLSMIQSQLQDRNDSTWEARQQGDVWPSAPTFPDAKAGEMTMNIDSGPAAVPSSSISSVGGNVHTAVSQRESEDLIHQAVLTLEQAQALLDVYASRLDHYLYCILGKTATLQGIRKSSPVLLAAVCTVGALHAPELGSLFNPCYRHFRRTVAHVALSEDASLGDIRGLCIGAFWLQDIAWNLSSIAVTLATQQHLHQASITTATHGHMARDRIRLYYFVYVCDHHFSIAYGRPPMTQKSELTASCKSFLDAPESTEDDARLVSQVSVWSIASEGLNLLGFNNDVPVQENLVPPMRRLIIALDTWRADWNERFGLNLNVGNYPRKGVKLHYHFAKLYLCSHAYRGLDPALHRSMEHELSASPHTGTKARGPLRAERSIDTSIQTCGSSILPSDLDEIAEAAVDSAQSILRIVTSDGEVQGHLNGLPLYFDTMIAFAIAFLFKVGTRYSKYVKNGASGSLDLIQNMAGTLRAVAKTMHRQHFLVALAPAVHQLLHARLGDSWQGDHGQIHTNRAGWEPNASIAGSPGAFFPATAHHEQDIGLGLGPGGFDWTSYDFLATSNEPSTWFL